MRRAATGKLTNSARPSSDVTIGSTGVDNGLPRGSYAVTVLGVAEIHHVPGLEGRMDDGYYSLKRPKYMDKLTFGFTFTVDGKTKTFDIKIDCI